MRFSSSIRSSSCGEGGSRVIGVGVFANPGGAVIPEIVFSELTGDNFADKSLGVIGRELVGVTTEPPSAPALLVSAP